jgi:2'-5' RNA ligase
MPSFKLPRLPSLAKLITAAEPITALDNIIDRDDDQYRRLTMTLRDLNPVLQDRQIRLAHYTWQRNPILRRVIDIQTEFVLGEGISVTSEDPAVNAVLQRHWNHPTNEWASKAFTRFRDLRLFGEACWTVAETPGTGTVILGVIDPERISRVVHDSVQVDEPVAVVIKSDITTGKEVVFKVIRYDPLVDGFDADATGYDGLCFYFAINKVATATRGLSDLFHLIDYGDAIDQFTWSQTERARIANAMVFDVSIKGGQQADVDAELKRIRTQQPTKPGGVNVHSDSIAWEILSPNLGATEAEVMIKILTRMVLGGAGLPEHYFAKGDETNRATAQEQSDPVIKRMTSIQREFVAMINRVLRYQYERARQKDSSLKRLSLEEPVPWRIDHPDMSVKDVAKIAAAFGQVTGALAEAEREGYVSKETARRAFLQHLKFLGVETDPQEEKDAIAAQPKVATSDYTQRPPAPIAAALASASKPMTAAVASEPSGAIVAFWLDRALADALAVPGGEPASNLHVTLAYLGDAASIRARRTELLAALSKFAQAQATLSGRISGVGVFNGAGETDPVYASVDVPELGVFRERLVTALEAAGFATDTTHGFTPHITLAFIPHGLPKPERGVLSVPIAFDSLTVAVAGERYVVPLKSSATVATEAAVAAQLYETRVLMDRRFASLERAIASRPAPVVNVDVQAPKAPDVHVEVQTAPKRTETLIDYDDKDRAVRKIEESS